MSARERHHQSSSHTDGAPAVKEAEVKEDSRAVKQPASEDWVVGHYRDSGMVSQLPDMTNKVSEVASFKLIRVHVHH